MGLLKMTGVRKTVKTDGRWIFFGVIPLLGGLVWILINYIFLRKWER
jgi:hypothetical protein